MLITQPLCFKVRLLNILSLRKILAKLACVFDGIVFNRIDQTMQFTLVDLHLQIIAQPIFAETPMALLCQISSCENVSFPQRKAIKSEIHYAIK